MRKVIGSVVAVAVVAAAVAVAMRRTPGTSAALEAVPADASSLVWVPQVSGLVGAVRTAAGRLGLEDQVSRPLASLSSQLGFDVTDPKALARAGLAPTGDLVVFTEGTEAAPVVGLTASDTGRLEATLRRVLAGRWARHFATRTDGGIEVTVATGPLHTAAWALRHRVLLVSEGAGAPARVVAAVRATQGLTSTPAFKAMRHHLGEVALLTYGTQGIARAVGAAAHGVGRVALGLAVSHRDLAIRGFATVDPAILRALAPLDRAGDARALLRAVDPGAIVALRLSFDPARAWQAVAKDRDPRLVRLRSGLAAAHLDVAKDLVPLLGHDLLVGARLAPAPDLSSGLPSLDPRRTNPFQYLKVTAQLRLTDPARAAKLLPEVARALGPALGATVTPVTAAGHRAFAVRYRLGAGMTFGIVKDVLVAAGGQGAFADAAARIESAAGSYREVVNDHRATDRLATTGGAATLLDVDTLLAAVHGLPASSLGGGTFGVMARAALNRVTAPLAGLHLVEATMTPSAGGVAFDARVIFQRPLGKGAG